MAGNYAFVRPRGIGAASLRRGPFYTVASVELGNTTTKCILTATNLETAEIFIIDKEVRLTREVRDPGPDETVFGSTIVGVELTWQSVSELVADVLTTVARRARLAIADIHFVVRSTGVTAGFASPQEVGEMVRALADGCLSAGVPPRNMTASLTPEQLPPGIRGFSQLNKVYFDGAVAGSLPPANTEIVANEMEGELVTAGLKGAGKSTSLDFRNPVMTLDFGTTLAGRVTDEGRPYAKTIGSFAGLAGAIPDAIVRGAGLVDGRTGSVLEMEGTVRTSRVEPDMTLVDDAHELITIGTVPMGTGRFGTVPVDTGAAAESGIVLIGIDVGTNGSDLPRLGKLGARIMEAGGAGLLMALIDEIQVRTVQRLVDVAEEEGLILKDTSLGLTGRAITTGRKPSKIARGLLLKGGERWTDMHQLLVAEDGLAMGAAVAARCMNSLGTPRNPMGGRKGDRCIMAERMRMQGGKGEPD